MPSGPAALVGSRLKRGNAYEIPFNIGIVAPQWVSNLGTFFQIHTFQKTHSLTNASAIW